MTTTTIEVKMKLARVTPGALRYEEVGVDGNVSAQPNKPGNKIGTLYIRKDAFKDAHPTDLQITISY